MPELRILVNPITTSLVATPEPFSAFIGDVLFSEVALLFGRFATDFIGEPVMTGPSTHKATAYSYIMVPNPEGGRDVVAAIVVGTASGTFVNENLVGGIVSGAIYLGSQDTDGDLIRDQGDPSWSARTSLC